MKLYENSKRQWLKNYVSVFHFLPHETFWLVWAGGAALLHVVVIQALRFITFARPSMLPSSAWWKLGSEYLTFQLVRRRKREIPGQTMYFM